MMEYLLLTLAIGGYGWTLIVYNWVREDIRELRENHVAHIHKHLRDECDDDCEYHGG